MTSHSQRYVLTLIALFFLLPLSTNAATLGISPANGTMNIGGTVTETVFVSSADQALNATAGMILFPADLLQVISVSKTNSILSLWVQDPTFSNTEGTISWSGVVPNPGFTGSYGEIFSIRFRGKQEGTANVIFKPSLSEVLANDGNGTNILGKTNAAILTVNASTPPAQAPAAPAPASTAGVDLLARITSSSHPDQTKWYKLSHAIFDWTNAQGVSAVRLGYDEDREGKPGVLYSDPISHKELDLEDGVWYFHVQERDSSGWGPIGTYQVQIDTVPPLPFSVTFLNGTTTAKIGDSIAVQFATDDKRSGIDHYQLIIDGNETAINAEEGSKPYAVTGDIGTHTLIVQAYDRAGNKASTEEKTFSITEGEPTSSLFSIGWLAVNYLTLVLMVLAVLGTLLFGIWYIRVHFSAYRRRLIHRLGMTNAHIHKEFDTLKEALTKEILALEQVKSKRPLTHEEERLIVRFKKLLDQSERAIEKEIEEIPR